MINAVSWLPPLEPCNGEWRQVVDHLYEIFTEEIKSSGLSLDGLPIRYDERILKNEKYEEGFWHLITKDQKYFRDGKKMVERLPDFRRAERLRWFAAVITNAEQPEIKKWDYLESSGDCRTYLWLKSSDYVAILEKSMRGPKPLAYTIITAFYVEGRNSRQKLANKWQKRII